MLYDSDDYVQALDGTQVQVKEVPINNGKHQPRQIVEAKQPQGAIAGPKQSQHPPLDEQIKQAKIRAQRLGLAHDAAEWVALLEASGGVTVIKSAVDLAKVNGRMTAIERGVIPSQEDAMEQEIRATGGVTL